MMLVTAWAMTLALTMAPMATPMASIGQGKPAPAALSRLRVEGANLVDPTGKVVRLEGPNLGNWFTMEMWMMGLTEGAAGIRDQLDFETILTERFGEAERARLMDEFRESWIQDQDFAIIRSFGFNAVRLPMNYRQFEDDARPMKLRPDAWKWVDRAVSMAGRHRLYVILDLHGVQGGQSVFDHTGHAGQNNLWTSPANRERFTWLWGQIARRFRNNPTVAAYDVVNEPFGGTHEQQLAVFKEIYPAIRAVDPDKLMYIPGHYDGFAHYGDPKTQGWKNVGVTMHYYPGLFGNGNPTPLTHARHLRSLENTAEAMRKLNVPFLVGEMNVVFDAAGGADMMRRTFDTHRKFGWSTTLWSYRVASTDGGHGAASWGMVTNPGPIQRIDLRKQTIREIEAWMRHLATEERVLNAPLKARMTATNPILTPLPEVPARITTAPANQPVPGWTATDIGGALAGGQQPVGANGIDLWGGGADIWGKRDQFRFLYQRLSQDFTLEATIVELADIAAYTKAGLMLRGHEAPDAAALLWSSFPGGTLQLAFRPTDGGEMGGKADAESAWPNARLRLQRRGETFMVSYQVKGAWREVAKLTWSNAPAKLDVGLVVSSHDNGTLATVKYRDVVLSMP